MRKIVVGMLLSLDGVAEAPDSFYGWDDTLDASIPRLIATQDAVILGRHSYDEWVQFWPGSEIEPNDGDGPDQAAGADPGPVAGSAGGLGRGQAAREARAISLSSWKNTMLTATPKACPTTEPSAPPTKTSPM